MTKKDLNQNTKLDHEFKEMLKTDFIFNNKPINRVNSFLNEKNYCNDDKLELLNKLESQINSIKDCKLKHHSKTLIMGDGNINSPIMLIGEAPGSLEDSSGSSYGKDGGQLLNKMLLAIGIKRKSVYTTYSVNYRPPDDRKPTANEISRYSTFLKDHVSIIDPKILVLLGNTAMQAVTGLNSKISDERGKWKEIILKNKTYLIMVTYSPSYLLRFPEFKKYSCEDLKKIRQKILNMNIKM